MAKEKRQMKVKDTRICVELCGHLNIYGATVIEPTVILTRGSCSHCAHTSVLTEQSRWRNEEDK
jgi:hypothetical protein